MQISITRALAELKLLNSRIERKIGESIFLAANKKSAKKVNNVFTKEEFVENAKADYQSVIDLIERRKKIKAAIVDSNAKTVVTIANKSMTVAEAIERKESIQYDKTLLNAMERQYNSVVAKVTSENEKVQQKLDDLLLTSFGKEGKQKASEDEIAVISKPYLEQNEFECIDPLEMAKKIRAMKEDIEGFTSEVDFILSESNTITKIEIPD
jgi:hypothetical protein